VLAPGRAKVDAQCRRGSPPSARAGEQRCRRLAPRAEEVVREGECGPPFRAVASKMKSWVARSLLKAQARAWRPTRRRRRAARSTASGAVDGEQLQRAARSTASGAVRGRRRAAPCASERRGARREQASGESEQRRWGEGIVCREFVEGVFGKNRGAM
jgi:hypothetical protein